MKLRDEIVIVLLSLAFVLWYVLTCLLERIKPPWYVE